MLLNSALESFVAWNERRQKRNFLKGDLALALIVGFAPEHADVM